MNRDRGKKFTILVTGASGYIGSRLCRRALEQGLGLVMMGRRRPQTVAEDEAVFHPFDLDSEPPPEAFDGVHAVIHMAQSGLDAGPDGDLPGDDLNVEGSRRLLAAARRAGIGRFIFISSQSSRADAPAAYGRNKWQVEKLLDGEGEVVVRPGLVYGGETRGVYGTLCRLSRLGPVLPLVGGEAPVHPIHRDELCDALLKIADPATAPQPLYELGAIRAMPFRRFLGLLARARQGRRLRVVAISLETALNLASLGEFLARAIPKLPVVRRERILGLADSRVSDTEASLKALGLTLGDPAVLLTAEAGNGRRRMIMEGRTLLAYVLGRRPGPALVRRYVRATGVLGLALPLVLPPIALRLPFLLRLWEPIVSGPSELMDRLAVAAAIAETTPQGARVFLALDKKPAVVAAIAAGLTLAWLAVTEFFTLPFRLLLGRHER